MEKTFKIVGNDISDGFHTFDELYEHRCLLFINLCLLHANRCAWKQDFDNWFCLYWESPAGQISYHIPNKFKGLIVHKIPEIPDYKWDEHKSEDVVNRLVENAYLKTEGRG